MEFLRDALEVFLHVDVHLAELTREYGAWTYGLLFVIIFCETGLVVTPLLPGDSLLFAAGSLATLGSLDPFLLFALLSLAAILGDTVNYRAGQYLGARIFKPDARFLKQAYLDRTYQFYERYGPKTIVLARFVPIVRTFAPTVAGVGQMHYPTFLTYNVVGGLGWVGSMTLTGYWLGRSIPNLELHLHWVIAIVILLSLLPLWREWRLSRRHHD